MRHYNIRVALKPVLTLRRLLTAPKDPIPTLDRPNVVYRIPCKECGAAYVGMTARPLKKRIQEHRRALRLGYDSISAVAKHCLDTAHPIDWDSVSVLDSASALQERLCKESIYIIREPQVMNSDPSYPLPRIWQPVVIDVERL